MSVKAERNRTLFCVLKDELLSASDEFLRETGQPHHVVRSHNELNVHIKNLEHMTRHETFYKCSHGVP